MRLVDLAQNDNLPLHQFMDLRTLSWIIKNRPTFIRKNLTQSNNLLREKLSQFIPPKEWFLVTDEVSTIHGLRHLLRVAIYSIKLCDLFLSESKKENLIVSAVLHDIRRLDSKKSPGHGERAARWFLDNICHVQKSFKIDLSSESIQEVKQAIHFHEIPYDKIEFSDSHKQYGDVIDILKTSDALDRYRQPKVSWWIDDAYLKIIPSDALKSFAYNLIIESEKLFLGGTDNARSVFEALERL